MASKMKGGKRIKSILPEIDQAGLRDAVLKAANLNISDAEHTLPELLQNAVDAQQDAKIKANRTKPIEFWINESSIQVRDHGVGMIYKPDEDLAAARKSGNIILLTSPFSSSKAKRADLAGQFGVGFFSTAMLGNRLTVYSKRKGHKAAILYIKDVQKFLEFEESGEVGFADDMIKKFGADTLYLALRPPKTEGTTVIYQNLHEGNQTEAKQHSLKQFVAKLGSFSKVPVKLNGDLIPNVFNPKNSPFKTTHFFTDLYGRKGWIAIPSPKEMTDAEFALGFKIDPGINLIIKGVYQITLEPDFNDLRAFVNRSNAVIVVQDNSIEMLQSRADISRDEKRGKDGSLSNADKATQLEFSIKREAWNAIEKFIKSHTNLEDSHIDGEYQLALINSVQDWVEEARANLVTEWAKRFHLTVQKAEAEEKVSVFNIASDINKMDNLGETDIQLVWAREIGRRERHQAETVFRHFPNVYQGVVKITLKHFSSDSAWPLARTIPRSLDMDDDDIITMVKSRAFTETAPPDKIVPVSREQDPTAHDIIDDYRRAFRFTNDPDRWERISLQVAEVYVANTGEIRIGAFFQDDRIVFNTLGITFGGIKTEYKKDRWRGLENGIDLFSHEMAHSSWAGGSRFSGYQNRLKVELARAIALFRAETESAEENKTLKAEIEALQNKLEANTRKLKVLAAEGRAKLTVLGEKGQRIDLSTTAGIEKIRELGYEIVSQRRGKSYFLVPRAEARRIDKLKEFHILQDLPRWKGNVSVFLKSSPRGQSAILTINNRAISRAALKRRPPRRQRRLK